MPRFSRSTRTLALVGGTLLVATSLAGCGQISSLLGGPQRDSDTNEVTEAGTDSVFDIKVGDCLLEPDASDDASSTEVTDIKVVPCSDEHDYEFYYDYDLDLGDTYPGDAKITEDADSKCADAFTDFVGVSVDESKSLWYTYYSPSVQSWNQDDRQIQCLVMQVDESGQNVVPVKGTLKGSKR